MLSQKSDVELIHGSPDEDKSDLPPAYDALSLHHSINHCVDENTGASAFLGPVAGPSNDPLNSDFATPGFPTLKVDKSSLPLPSLPLDDTPSTRRNASHPLVQRPRPRKNTSWLSLLPFVSSFSAKRVRQSVLSVVSDLVLPPSRTSSEETKNVHEILASVAETCAEHKVSLSTILQETFIANHTPMYWAIVHYRPELLVALLVYSRPLSTQTISDIRRACLVSSNQALFHALRVCHPPFHRTDGIQVQTRRTASDNLLLGTRPLDEIRIQQTSDQTFVVFFVIPLWQRRMKATGQVGVEFIASGRMWSVIFFSTGPSSPMATSGKLRKCVNTWHVMISLLESSPPTFFDSQLVVDVSVLETIQTTKLRETRSTAFLSLGDKQCHNRSSMYDHNYDGKTNARPLPDPPGKSGYSPPSPLHLSPPVHPLRSSALLSRSNTATLPLITIRLGCGNRMLARRTGTGESMETPTMKADTWSDHGVGYTSAVVSALGEGLGCQLLYDHSPYLHPDGTLGGRLEAKLVRTERSKDCIIC